MSESSARGMRKTRTGRVTSNKMDKTVVVSVQTTMRHPLYQKAVRRDKKLFAHDETGECRIGDVVRVAETRPMSKLKRWRVTEIVERSRE